MRFVGNYLSIQICTRKIHRKGITHRKGCQCLATASPCRWILLIAPRSLVAMKPLQVRVACKVTLQAISLELPS
ncbi:hypothetical protein PISMIDRAFT_685259 [Pisolithus microcarpus 441]|uniref:Uncharacterized protein n=1 Tax=Pisolithus microcarpus 441 TaxID=765257 RepID=A0A0C9YLJ1_9AGAM|nr:hypothetical protein PISMIDRAFT_685259 [Pisolithus microcarpus 441]